MTRTRSTAEILDLVARASAGTHNEEQLPTGLWWCLTCGTLSDSPHLPAKVALDTADTMVPCQ